MRKLPAPIIALLVTVVIAGGIVLAAQALRNGSPRAAAPTVEAATVPEAIDATGADDVTEQLNEYLASLPDGARVVLPPGAVYRVEGTVRLPQASGVLVVGNGGQLLATTDGSGVAAHDGKEVNWPRQRAHLIIEGGSDITIRGLRIRGPNTDARYDAGLEAQHGVAVVGARNVLLEDLVVDDVWGDFVAVTSGSSQVTVLDGMFSGAGRQGFSVDQAEDVIFQGAEMTRVARSAIDIEPQLDWAVRRVAVRDIRFIAPIANAIIANLGSGSAVEDVVVEHNVVEGVRWSALSGTDRQGTRARYRFTGNVSDTATNHGPVYRFQSVTDVLVEGSEQTFRGKDVGPALLFLEGTCGEVRDNEFAGAEADSEGVVACPAELAPPTPAVLATGAG